MAQALPFDRQSLHNMAFIGGLLRGVISLGKSLFRHGPEIVATGSQVVDLARKVRKSTYERELEAMDRMNGNYQGGRNMAAMSFLPWDNESEKLPETEKVVVYTDRA